jgi:hypothetical protein
VSTRAAMTPTSSMSRTVQADAFVPTAKSDPRGRDILTMAAGMAHADAERGRTASEVARRYSTAGRPTSRRAASEWRRVGLPEHREFTAYLLVCSDPFRIEASVRVTVKQRAIGKLTTPELITRYRELLAHEPRVEAEDRVLSVSRGVRWVERASASERDSAIDAEKAACEREFAARGVTEDEVFGGPR